jgi:hypothetical protein
MDFHERLLNVLRGQPADTIPFAPYDNLVPRGLFERQMRSRGMGLLKRVDEIWSECPGLRQEITSEGQYTRITYHTPVGSVSSCWKGHLGRIDDRGEVQTEWLIKERQDFTPVSYMIEQAVYHEDYAALENSARDLGPDGLVRGTGPWPPYDTLEEYFGLFNWAFAQQDFPQEIESLLHKIEDQEARRFPYVLASPAEFISFGSLSGFYSPKQFEHYLLPFYQKYVPLLKNRGKICALHAHNSNLRSFKDLLKETGVQVIEAYTPPPVSDLPIQEARQAWGSETTIWVNFPETIFWSGVQNTYRYTLDLIEKDPCPDRLVIGFTEMGTYGITDDESEQAFKEGVVAIIDAIDDFAGRR